MPLQTKRNTEKRRISRAEKSELTRRALIEAAAKVVGEHGYSNASIARITMAANVAQGTIYNYFDSRDDLFNQLLPEVGRMMVQFIAGFVIGKHNLMEKERARIHGYLAFLHDNPGFYRVLQEAETFAPNAHRAHMENMVSGYCRALKHDFAEDGLVPLPEAELEAVVYILLGARSYLAMQFFDHGPRSADTDLEAVVETYAGLVERGLLGISRHRAG